MSSYKDYKKRALQNPEVKAEYYALKPEYDIIKAMIDEGILVRTGRKVKK